MMHRRGESDSAIVAGKPTNKVERSAAEPVEPRAEAKGNARQQSTDRTQSRGTVSQALELRIRQAARQRKKERSSPALLHTTSASIWCLRRGVLPDLGKMPRRGVDGLSLDGLRTKPRAQSSRTCMLASIGERIPGTAVHGERVYTQAGWPAAARSLDCRPRGQDRPAGDYVAVLNAIYEEDFLGWISSVWILSRKPGAARTTHWMRSLSGSRARR